MLLHLGVSGLGGGEVRRSCLQTVEGTLKSVGAIRASYKEELNHDSREHNWEGVRGTGAKPSVWNRLRPAYSHLEGTCLQVRGRGSRYPKDLVWSSMAECLEGVPFL